MRTRLASWVVGGVLVAVVGCSDNTIESSASTSTLPAIDNPTLTASKGARRHNANERAVEELVLAYAAACNAGDADAYAALLDENFHQMPPDAPIVDGRDNVWANMAATFQAVDFEQFTINNTRLELRGEYGFLWGTHSYYLTVIGSGDPPAYFEGKHLSILKRQSGGGWLFYADCWNANGP